MGNAELFYSALPPGSSSFRRRGKQHCPALQKRFPEIHLKVGGKEGAFAPEDHSEQQLTLKGRLPKKMDLSPCTGIHHIHLLPSRYPETDHRNCSGRQHRRDFPMASRKGKFSLPETGSGLRFMRRAGIQPNPRLRKKTGGWLHNRTGNGGLREQISSGLYFFQAHPNIHWCIKSLFRKRAWAFLFARYPGNADFSDVLPPFSGNARMPAPLPLFYFARGKDGSRLRASGRIL